MESFSIHLYIYIIFFFILKHLNSDKILCILTELNNIILISMSTRKTPFW